MNERDRDISEVNMAIDMKKKKEEREEEKEKVKSCNEIFIYFLSLTFINS